MAVLDKIIGAKKKEFDALRKAFFPKDSLLKLLKVSETTNDFDEIDILASGWYLKYSETRQAFRLMIARNDYGFNEDMLSVTHVDINDDVYTVAQADTIVAQGEDPVWTFFCERFMKRSQFKSLY
jgi:hypothetical protein